MACILLFVLFIAAKNMGESAKCKGVKIVINDAADNFFIAEKDVKGWVDEWASANVETVEVDNLKIEELENLLAKKVWIEKAEVFFDDEYMLHINISERAPLARVFNSAGQSFYLDAAAHILPIHLQMAARVPVFTNYTGSLKQLSRGDSGLLAQTVFLGAAVMKDSFLMAMVEQIDINEERKFEMIPKLGNHIIHFGDTTALEAKFLKLKTFYKEVLAKKGWNMYSAIYLDYKDQVVAKIRDSADVQADATRTLMLMELMVTKAKATTSDSIVLPKPMNDVPIDSTVLLQSVERDDEEDLTVQETPVRVVNVSNKNLNAATGLAETKTKPKVVTEKKAVAKTIKVKAPIKTAAPQKSVIPKKELPQKLPDKPKKAIMPKKTNTN